MEPLTFDDREVVNEQDHQAVDERDRQAVEELVNPEMRLTSSGR
jgi:hypothetical protein